MSHYDAEYERTITPGLPSNGRALVLVAEPNLERRAEFVQALERAGYEVACITDPARAAAEAGRMMPALVIARVVNAGTDGFSLCREFRLGDATRDTPLLVVTDLDDLFAREQIVRAGATAILVEPLRRSLLLRHVRRMLARGVRTGQVRSVMLRTAATAITRPAL
jgi:PleD family two-component response regulator